MIITKSGYIFNIDINATKSIYNHIPKEVFKISDYLPELTNFLFSLGIDINKPIKYNLNDSSDLVYIAVGKYTCEHGYEIDFYGDDKFVSTVFYMKEKNHIEIEVFGIKT